MKIALAIVLALAGAAAAEAKTYYVRADGGTAGQCDGLTDAAYPARSGKACAWAHPFWAIEGQWKWKIAGGDTLSIGPGSYRIGWQSPNSDWCLQVGVWTCGLPPLPSGLSKEQPTRLVGAGWDKGCAVMPELWGTNRVRQVVDLSGTDHAVVACLEITDHSSCAEVHPDPAVRCVRDNPPFGDWGALGIFADRSSDVLLRNLNIHGLGSRAVLGGKLTDWTVEDTRMVGHPAAGFDLDLGGGQPTANKGTLAFRRVKVEWNGCAETYPGREPDHCLAGSKGGYGDGFVTGKSSGKWIIEDSSFRHNTSDGIDLLYLEPLDGVEPAVEIRRTISAGNAGNQIKVAGNALIVNTVAVSNCAFFLNKPFAQDMGDAKSGDHCRARGGAIALAMTRGAKMAVINSTVASQGDTMMVTECRGNGLPACDAESQLTLRNNIMVGYGDFFEGDVSGFMWDPSNFARGRVDHNLIFRFKEAVCPPGNICQAPGFISDNIDSFDGHLRGSSPAIDAGLGVGEASGMIPADDIGGARRPTGRGVELGAYEYVSPSAATAPLIESIRSAAGGDGEGIAPGALITIRGLRLSAQEKTAAEVPYPSELGNVDVRFGELPARLLYVSGNAVNAQVPQLTAGDTVAVTVRSAGEVSDPVEVRVEAVAPALFEMPGPAPRQGAVTNAEGELIGAENAAVAGQVLIAYATGLGAAEGEAADGLLRSRMQPRVYVADVGAEVLFAGPNPASPGLDQINFRLPAGLAAAPDMPLWIEQGDRKSQRVQLATRGFE